MICDRNARLSWARIAHFAPRILSARSTAERRALAHEWEIAQLTGASK